MKTSQNLTARAVRWLGLVATVATVGTLAACGTVANNTPTTTAATTPPPRFQGNTPASLLWVGNSFFYFNNSMHGHLGGLLNAAGVKGVRQTSVTISGAGLDWHDVGTYLKPGSGMARYSFTPTNDVVFNSFDRAYDMVLMMDCSQCPIHPKLQQAFHDTAKADAAIVRQAGAEPALFLSWAYQDQPQMTAQLAEQYAKAGRANAMEAPAAIARSRHRRSCLRPRPGRRRQTTTHRPRP